MLFLPDRAQCPAERPCLSVLPAGRERLAPDSWPDRCSVGGMQKLHGKASPICAAEGEQLARESLCIIQLLNNVGQRPPYTWTGRASGRGLRYWVLKGQRPWSCSTIDLQDDHGHAPDFSRPQFPTCKMSPTKGYLGHS